MRSSNPVLSRRGFTSGAGGGVGGGGYAGFNTAPAGPAMGGNPYATNPYAADTYARQAAAGRPGAMTMDDVVSRTAITLGTVVVTAVLAWLALPVDEANLGKSYGIAFGAAIVALVLGLIQSFKRRPAPALIVAYAAFEGFFLGVLSNVVSTYIAPGVVVEAVLGTMAVFAGTLLAYRMRWIRVTRRFTRFVTAAAMGFLILMFVNLLFSLFTHGDGLGFRSGGLGIAFGIIGIVLGACFLALDFKQVEDGVAHGAPREESWLAAFGLTMTLVWIYLEVLRVLSILQSDN
ncbi:Bax inhibitor-1/YccA family protein [Streptomyces montanisoli]|uniref:Bax inhibitor-1/YccA family protein n=1 Tax=Streptomyces montanisoli TaxID=2798581 RepID=A0A940MD17_9ACTN|nr:Bax inhibitor-1/YccA family protein [Streptomyces montanisoli]MBP0457392.1 Bax inhibitor-1/YccA family protein [Streptomyces montanisoli]